MEQENRKEKVLRVIAESEKLLLEYESDRSRFDKLETLIGNLRLVRENVNALESCGSEELSAALTGANEKLRREIDERKISESIMRGSAQKYEAIFNGVYDALFINHLDRVKNEPGIILEANEAALKLTGYSLKELKGVSPEEIIAPNRKLKEISARLTAGEEVIYEAEIISRERKPILCEIRSRPFRFGNIELIVSVCRDIREWRRAENLLHRREKELLESHQIANLGNWRYDLNSRTFKCSEQIFRIFGAEYDPESMLTSLKFLSYVHPEDLSKVSEFVADLKKISQLQIEYRIIRKDGKVRCLQSICRGELNFAGELVAHVGITQDITEKKLAEENLRQSEANLRTILQATSKGIWEWSIPSRRLNNDPRLLRFLGFDPDRESVSFHDIFKNLVHPEDRERTYRSFRELLSGNKETIDCSYRIKNKDGHYLWILSRAVAVKNLSGEIEKFIGCIEDLSESQRIDKIKEQLEFQQKLLDNIPIPIYYKSPEGKYLGFNRAFLELFPAEIGECLIGSTVFDALRGENSNMAAIINNLDQKMLVNGEIYCKTFQFIGPSGDKRFLILQRNTIRDQKGSPYCLVGSIIDITNLKKAQKNLRATTRRLNTTMNAMQEMIMCFDRDLKLLWGNRTARETLAQNRRFIGGQWQEIWGPVELRGKKTPVQQIITRQTQTAHGMHYLANGKIYEVWAYAARDPGERTIGAVEVALDVTEREKAQEKAIIRQEQLIQADKMKSLGILVAGVAHEINNPNNFIMINISLLEKIFNDAMPLLEKIARKEAVPALGGIPLEKLRDSINSLTEGISEGSERISVIVDSLKTYARQTSSDLPQLFNVNDAISKSLLLLKSLLQTSTGNFQLTMAADIPPVTGFQQRIEQVIINVVQNACQALPDPSRKIAITSKYLKHRSKAVIEINDEGCGIPPEDLLHITDPFFTTKRNIGGTGLGLSISSAILEEHNGKLQIKSTPGKGTSVKIFLPALPPNPEKSPGKFKGTNA